VRICQSGNLDLRFLSQPRYVEAKECCKDKCQSIIDLDANSIIPRLG